MVGSDPCSLPLSLCLPLFVTVMHDETGGSVNVVAAALGMYWPRSWNYNAVCIAEGLTDVLVRSTQIHAKKTAPGIAHHVCPMACGSHKRFITIIIIINNNTNYICPIII